MATATPRWSAVPYALAAMIAASAASPALADIVVITGFNNVGTENLDLDGGQLDSTVNATGGLTGGRVTLTGAEDLATATLPERVVASDGAFTILTIAPTDASNLLTGLVINLNALSDGFITLKVAEAHGFDFQGSFFVDANGENPFTITAINGQLITSVEVSGATLSDVRQLRAGFQGLPPTTPVPEPLAWTLMVAGFGMSGLLLRRAGARRWRPSL